MQVSIVIPTYNRVKDLEECLDSIGTQTELPTEIIIVDNANNVETEKLVMHKTNKFKEKRINLKYIRNGGSNSATIARNIGIDAANGEILLFLDDDVILDKDFSKEILRVYKEYPNALGVQGYITNMKFNRLSNLILKFFFLTYSEKDHNKLLPSMRNVYAYPLTKIIKCEWLMSGCTCYKRDIFKWFKFDEKLYKYSAGDDADFSYRVSKSYPGSLYQTPFAMLIHKVSYSGRAPKKEVIFVGQVYHIYLFYKNIDQKLKNKLIFLWSRIGYLHIKFGVFILKPSKENLLTIKYLISAYIYCLRHIKDIGRRDIAFFTKTLMKD